MSGGWKQAAFWIHYLMQDSLYLVLKIINIVFNFNAKILTEIVLL